MRGPAERPANNWLEIELLDGFGRPMAGERYRVQTADGRVLEGRLDASGRRALRMSSPDRIRSRSPIIQASGVELEEP